MLVVSCEPSITPAPRAAPPDGGGDRGDPAGAGDEGRGGSAAEAEAPMGGGGTGRRRANPRTRSPAGRANSYGARGGTPG